MKRTLSILLITLAPTSAEAAGFYITDIGARGIARGGAFVANPDSVLAAHYNPAGLSLLRGFNVHLDLSLVDFAATFDRRCPCADPDHPDAAAFDAALETGFAEAGVQRSRTPLLIPFIGLAYGFEPLNTTVALTLHGPTSGRHDWGEPPSTRLGSYGSTATDFTGRYSAHIVKNVELNGALSAAFEPIPGVRLGASALVFMTKSEQGQTLWANFDALPDAPEDTDHDVPLVFSMTPSYFLNWAVGGSWEIVNGLTLGTSFRGKRSLRGGGKIQAGLPRFLRDSQTNEPLLGAKITGEDAEVELNIAPVWRTGIEYRVPGIFRAEAAAVYEGWSTHQTIVLTPKDIVIDVMGTTTNLPRITIKRGWKDTIALRLGGEFEMFEPYVGLRAGYFYETSAVPEQSLSISRIDRPKHGISVGAATTFEGITVELGLAYIHLISADISDSSVKIVAPFPAPLGSDELVSTVGNGTIAGDYLIAALSVGYKL